ncbi:MAG: DNA-methyltransferase [Blastococcus sp.]
MTPYYSDDRATLYRGDALAVLRELPDASVDAVITDPPYSSGGMTRGDRSQDTGVKYVSSNAVGDSVDFAGDNRDQRAYAYWSALWLAESLRVVRPSGVVLLFTDWRQLPTTADALQAGGWVWRGIVPWAKSFGARGARPMAGRFAAQCEYVVWGSRGGMPIRMYEDECLPGFYQANAPRDREHQTQKPLEVMRQLVRIVPEGGTLLDPFMGAGTTGVAAIHERRRFIGCEITEHYADVAERRIRIASGQAVDDGEQAAIDFGEAS